MKSFLKQSFKTFFIPAVAYCGFRWIIGYRLGAVGYLLIILTALIIRGWHQKDWRMTCSVKQCKRYFMLALFGVGLSNVFALLIFGFDDIQHQIPKYAYNWEWYICIAVLAPIAEELVFRGIILRNWSANKRYSMVGVVLSGLVFGLSHHGSAIMFAASTFGITLGFLYLKTNSVVPGILLHILINTTVLTKFTNKVWLDYMKQIIESGYITTILYIALSFCILFILLTLKVCKFDSKKNNNNK